MFGYLSADEKSLDAAELERYGAHYCGLCRAIGRRCGQKCRLALRHDLAFLSILLGSLYEPPENAEGGLCPLHPLRERPRLHTPFTDYAADLNTALAYHKLLDDWHDDRNPLALAGAAALKAPYEAVSRRLPRQCRAIESGLAEIGRIEATSASQPDEAAIAFGAVMGELFVVDANDVWAPSLYALGDSLGRFIYVMDALCDLPDDRRTGSYNPLAGLDIDTEAVVAELKGMAGSACAVFERLPLDRDLHLLRSVLYSGIWQRWHAEEAKRERRGSTDACSAPDAAPRRKEEVA